VTWAAYGPQKPSSGGIREHDVSENDISVIRIPPGQKAYGPASDGRPQQDSNLRSRLRRALITRAMTSGNEQPSHTLGCAWGAG
jgi:hypothetical protein